VLRLGSRSVQRTLVCAVLCHAMLRCDALYQDVKACIPSFDMQRRLDESYVAILNHMYLANRICFSYRRYLPIRLVQMVPCLAPNGRSRLSRFPTSALRLQMFGGSTTTYLTSLHRFTYTIRTLHWHSWNSPHSAIVLSRSPRYSGKSAANNAASQAEPGFGDFATI
jgi:hypothetical protein